MKNSEKTTCKTAIILLGGRGTRIAGLYPDRPKCLIPVNGHPILEWQLEMLRDQGIERVHLAAGHMANMLEDWLQSCPIQGLTLSWSAEPKPLGTGGGLRYGTEQIDADHFFVINGDSLAPAVKLRTLEHFMEHFPNIGTIPTGPKVTLAVIPAREAGRYGSVDFDANGLVTAFAEKADRQEGMINAGIYFMEKAAVTNTNPDTKFSLEQDTFPYLAAEHRLGCILSKAPLLDMGTPEGLQEMEEWLHATA